MHAELYCIIKEASPVRIPFRSTPGNKASEDLLHSLLHPDRGKSHNHPL